MELNKTPEDILEEQQEALKKHEGGLEINDENTFEQYRDNALETVTHEVEQVKADGSARLETLSNSFDLPEEEVSIIREELHVDEALAENEQALDELARQTTEQMQAGDEGSIEKEQVKEQFQAKRAGMLTNILTSDIVNAGLNFIPFAGGGKMIIESVVGKELNGEDVDGKSRIIHGAVGAGSLALDFTGVGEAVKVGVIAGKSIRGIQKVSAAFAKRGAAKQARVFEKTADFMGRHPQITARAEAYVDNKIRGVASQIDAYRHEHGSAQAA
jgi:hypothetical protein